MTKFYLSMNMEWVNRITELAQLLKEQITTYITIGLKFYYRFNQTI